MPMDNGDQPNECRALRDASDVGASRLVRTLGGGTALERREDGMGCVVPGALELSVQRFDTHRLR